ncbi:MAG: COG4223 family protein, partial [Pseudolabrys sp.]
RAAGAPPPSEPAAPPPAPGGFGALAAGVAGGLVAAAAFGVLWYADLLPARSVPSADGAAQLAALQKQVQDLANRPAPVAPPAPPPDTRLTDALAQRVARMESAFANLPKGDTSVGERLTAAENAMKSLGVALTALNQRSDDAANNAARAREQAEAAEKAMNQLRGSVQEAAKDASAAVAPAQLEGLQQRLAALEQAVKAARDDAAKAAAADAATRLALSASALRAAVMRGVPYAAELAQVKQLGADERRLAPLAPFAASGLPSASTLAQELRAALPEMAKASGAPTADGGFLEKLQANASKLVRVQPIDAPPGDDPSAVLARVELAAARGDAVAALADIAKLPEKVRTPAQAFVVKAKARQAAIEAADAFAADTARSLGSR